MDLNEGQRRAVEYHGQHLLLLAGAGTGKTTTIIARIAHLIRTGTPPSRILAMTFTRRAANEIKARLKAMFGPVANEVVAGTFHFFCLSVMKRMPKAFSVEENTVIDRDDQKSLMKLARSEQVEKGEEFPNPNILVNYYSYARNTGLSPKEYLEKFTEHDGQVSSKIIYCFQAYERRKQKNKYLDFDDILFIFAEKLASDPRIREQLRGVFDHILVDETQDTNPLQFKILTNIMNPGRLYCVGDDAQSIYAFRGADFKNVHSFTERILDSEILRLEENYRSTQEILDLSNWLLEKSPLGYNKRLKAFRGSGIKPKVVDFNGPFDEARWICEKLVQNKEKTNRWADNMVLTRTAYAARSLETVLIENNIPYIFIGGTSLLEAAHIKDLLSLCRVAINHHDELAWVRYLTLWPRIGTKSAENAIDDLLGCATQEDVQKVLMARFRNSPAVVEGYLKVKKHQDSPRDALVKATEHMNEILRKYDRWDMRLKDIKLLVKLADGHRSLKEFIETYTLDPITYSAADRTQVDDAVVLITVHSAKGTESLFCFIIQAQAGMYPHSRSLGDPDQEEEERRILYVAMTRAKDELVITRAGGDWGYSSFSSPESPYFLNEVPPELIDEHHEGVASAGMGQASFRSLKDF